MYRPSLRVIRCQPLEAAHVFSHCIAEAAQAINDSRLRGDLLEQQVVQLARVANHFVKIGTEALASTSAFASEIAFTSAAEIRTAWSGSNGCDVARLSCDSRQ